MAVRRKKGRVPTPPRRVSRNPPPELTWAAWLLCRPCDLRGDITDAGGADLATFPADLNDHCPRCGKVMERMLTATVANADQMVDGLSGLRIRARPVGSRKWTFDHTDRLQVYSETGELQRIVRTYDHVNNLYTSRYTSAETGEVRRETCEPLTEHRGHGSARRRSEDTR